MGDLASMAGAILEGLGRASLEGAVFALAVWGLCKAFPRLPAALRCWLWWAVCVRFLLVLVGVQPVALALLPAPKEAPGAPAVMILQAPLSSPAPLLPATGPEPAFRMADALRWEGGLLAGLWLAGALALLIGTAGQLREARRILRRSLPLREGGLVALFADLGGRLGVRRSELRLSEDIRTPQVIGLWKPRVLLPHPGAGRLSRFELTMTLCHELLHVRRLDLWLGWLPALAQRLFFFHPLARLAAREYALAREAACDAGVLRWLGAAPAAYGDLLLRLGVVPRGTALAAAGASPSFQNLKRRLEMLQNLSDTAPSSRVRWTRWGLWTLAGAVALAALVPVRITAAEAEEKAAEPVPAVEAVPAVPAVAATPAVYTPGALPPPVIVAR
ncbi:MAG TPA: M56 family metallopeptidase, partial [Thermoanaerobaculia bacterium]|nr:M56 family metallopeptidase [Thermoanaerobaculia bacterium]